MLTMISNPPMRSVAQSIVAFDKSGIAGLKFVAGVEDGSIGVTLLADIRIVFDERKSDTVPSTVLAERLCKIEGRLGLSGPTGRGCRQTT
jgi:hypothetical protein